MIKRILLPVIAIVMFTSCASKFNLQKRKYTKGFYIAKSTNCKHNSNNFLNASKTDNVNKLTLNKVVEPIQNNKKVEAEVKTLPIIELGLVKTITTTKKVETKKNVTASILKQNTVVVKAFKELKLNSKKNQVNYAKATESGAKFVIMVILCLFPFINLIPVFIHDGNKATLNFWITLLLNFTLIGGVIFALLVIFDIVDSA